MKYKDLEQKFEEVLDADEYETASDAIYRLTRKAFFAGFRAAAGEPPDKRKIVAMPKQA